MSYDRHLDAGRVAAVELVVGVVTYRVTVREVAVMEWLVGANYNRVATTWVNWERHAYEGRRRANERYL